MKTQIEIKPFFPERVIFAIFFLYLEWYKEIWSDRPIILYGTVALLTGLVFIRMLRERRFQLQAVPPLLKMYFLYFFYSFSGLIVAVSASHMLSGLKTYICLIVVCFDCWYVSCKLGSHDWMYKVFKYVAFICAMQVLFFGQPFWNGIEVTTMSSTNNPNTVGLMLVIGILSFALTTNQEKITSFAVALTANVAMLYGIVLTGSRKCLLSAGAVFVFWLFTYVKTMVRQHRYKQLFLIMGCMAAGLYVCISYIQSSFQDTSAFVRLTNLFSEGGITTRENLYKKAFEFFKTSPIIGIGYNQYELWSSHGLYSHSSYAEILSCGGIIGTLIFYIPLAKCLYNCARNALSKRYSGDMYRARMVALLFLCELFLGVGQIFIYDVLHLLVLMLIAMEKSSRDPATCTKRQSLQSRKGLPLCRN